MGARATHFGDVHAAVLRQHGEIRARLRGLDPGGPSSVAVAALSLRVSLFRLAILFESHLRYEELELAPLMRDSDAWGPVREAAMQAEHVAQRTRLEYVCMVAETDPGPGDELLLSREVSALVVTLLEDMAHEESDLAQLSRVLEGCFDQMTG